MTQDTLGCNNQTISLGCTADTILSIVEADYGRSDHHKCQSINMSKSLCSPIYVTNILKKKCQNKRRCNVEINTKTFGKMCNDDYLQIKYQCIARPRSPSPCDDNPCGFGAICKNVKGAPVCSCPVGTMGNAKVRCCKKLTCG